MRKVTIAKIRDYINGKAVDLIDALYDYKITGKNLTKIEKSPFQDNKRQIGATDSQPTHYLILKKVFSHVDLSSADAFIDIGCGKGRALAFLLNRHCPCPLYGVEISEVPGRIALEWTKKHDNIHVVIGDALEQNYDAYTVLYLSRPFLTNTFLRFIDTLESQMSHAVTLIYLYDQVNGYMLKSRPGWSMKYREVFFKIHGLKVAGSPQGFSIWEYDPNKADTSDAP